MGVGPPFRRRSSGVVAVVVGLVMLTVPAGAPAATLYVDDDSPMTIFPCDDPPPANACETITEAISHARNAMFPGPDTIMVAAGNYPEEVRFDDDDDAGNTLDGAGTSTTGSGTVVQVPTGMFFTAQRANITIKDLAIQGSNTQTVFIGSTLGPAGAFTGAHLENILVEIEDQANAESAIQIASVTNAVLDDVEVAGDEMWDGASAHALEVGAAPNLVVNDSNLSSNHVTLLVGSSSVRLNRTTVAGTLDFDEAVAQVNGNNPPGQPVLTLDSSRLIFGDEGLNVTDNSGAAMSSAVVRNSTIDADVAQSPTGAGVSASQVGAADVTDVTIDSSIVVGALSSTGGGTGTMTCTYSDVPNTTQAAPLAISCATGAGNPGNNSSSAPSALFDPGFAGLNWHLKAGGPAIDTGDPGPLAAGQSTTDIEGNPRVLDGNLDCIARRDMGAYEETGLSAPCPSPSPSTPGTTPATGNPSGVPSKKKCKKRRKGKTTAAFAAKKKKCKKKRKKPAN